METIPPPLRLLIVDDDENIRAMLAQRFRPKAQSAATAAGTGEEALSAAAKNRFDVALLDLHLPGIDGIEVLGRFKEGHPELEPCF